MSDSLFGFTSSFIVPTIVSIAVGTTPITSGSNGRLFFDDAGVVGETNGAFWDKANSRIGFGTITPAYKVDVVGNIRSAIGTATTDNYTFVADITQSNNIAPGSFVSGGILITGTYTDNNTANNTVYNPFLNVSPTIAFGLTSGLSGSPRSFIRFSPIVSGAGKDISTATYVLNISPSFTNRNLSNVIGIYYNPSFTVGSNTNHRAIETVTGDVLFATTSGSLLVGTSILAGFKADINGTLRVQGQVNIQSASLLTISSVLTAYADVTFSVNGASGGYQGGYTFKSGAGGNAGNTALKISSPSTTISYVGIGNFTTADIGAGTGKLHIENTIATGRNAAIKLRVGFADIFNQLNGIQFDTIELGGGGAFLGSQRNTPVSGYGADLVVLTTLDTLGANAYTETARFIGRYNSFYVGTDKTLAVPSAKMQLESTTQGFLPPRMTTAQINAIASPAEGLQVYNTTISHMCVYQAGAWAKLSHSPM
jgi:hypothetical protein